MTIDHPFLAFNGGDNQGVYINTLQIRRVVFGANGADVFFSETDVLHLDGIGASELTARLMTIACALDGSSFERLG